MVAFGIGSVIWGLAGLAIGWIVWKVGIGFIRSMMSPLPPPPPPGEMRKINVRYQCSVCGVELKMLLAPDEDPPPPRHCLEDMLVIAPLYD